MNTKIDQLTLDDRERAALLVEDKVRVIFGFDGEETVDSNNPGKWRRAVGWGGEESTFTWKRFITLEDSYNPSPGKLNPWSLKNWYIWGMRKFHFHNPFGKVVNGKKQKLVYEVDQFLNAKNGLRIDGEVQNTKMPWLVNDFVPVIKALTTGMKGDLDQETWDSWTTGPDAWFKPEEPIELVVYIGSLADPGISDAAYATYIKRWNDHFNKTPSGALARLKSSVAPLIEANCKIGFDAAVAAASSIPGQKIPLDRQGVALQKGWWSFWKWINKKIGKSRVYVESHPFKENGVSNPYLGSNIIADDDWSTSLCCPADPSGTSGPHMTSEMGTAEFWRCLWQQAVTRTPLIARRNNLDVLMEERYWFLRDSPSATWVKSEYTPEQTEWRLSAPNCCGPNHNYYWYDLMGDIIVFHLLFKQNIRGETNEAGNVTRNGIMISNSILQVLPPAFEGDPRWDRQFGVRFSNKGDLINYVAKALMQDKAIGT